MGDAERIGYETRLRAAVLAGDEAAWRAWYDACADRIERYVRWRCGGVNDLAGDVLQETWLVAVRKIADFDPQAGSFRQWLRGIAGNTVRNHLRNHRLAASRKQSLNGDEAASVPTDDEKAYRMAAALAELSPPHERVLRAKYLDGRSMCQLAAASGKSVKAIESLLSRARAAFRIAYEKSCNG